MGQEIRKVATPTVARVAPNHPSQDVVQWARQLAEWNKVDEEARRHVEHVERACALLLERRPDSITAAEERELKGLSVALRAAEGAQIVPLTAEVLARVAVLVDAALTHRNDLVALRGVAQKARRYLRPTLPGPRSRSGVPLQRWLQETAMAAAVGRREPLPADPVYLAELARSCGVLPAPTDVKMQHEQERQIATVLRRIGATAAKS
jgi:hypothetical protein